MRKENRINCFIPGDTEVCQGYRDSFSLERYSPGDLIVENINSAGCTYIKTDLGSRDAYPGGRLLAKYFRDEKSKVTIEVTDNYTLTRKDGEASPVIGNYSSGLIVKGISAFLQNLVYYWDRN